MNEPTNELRILLHAPSPTALARARSNAANITKDAPQTVVRIVVNADAVVAVLNIPDAAADPLTLVCPNTLTKLGRNAPAPLTVLSEGAVLALVKMQIEGWYYVRA